MHLSSAIIAGALFFVVPVACCAGVDLYAGIVNITAVSGKACAGAVGKHEVSLVLRHDKEQTVSGYFEGQGMTLGHFSGKEGTPLEVRYPLDDESKAGGHSLTISPVPTGLLAELRDRHLDSTADDCNFDLADMTLRHVAEGEAAETRFNQLDALFESQLLRSRAFNLARTGSYVAALPLYEKSLTLAERSLGKDSDQLLPYITSLANAYVRQGEFDKFDQLYDLRYASIKDEGVKAILSSYRIRSLLMSGKTSLLRENHGAALEDFMKAYRLQPQSREAIASVMMAHLRMENYDKAIDFLESVGKSADAEGIQQDVQSALAQVYALRARKRDRSGEAVLAESDLRRSEALEPHAVQYLIALARLRHKTGNLAEAEDILKKGLERFTHESDRQQIFTARDRLRQIDSILAKLRSVRG
ncbi:tetratricopeptide repeat protein [Pelotalea chapellei]|uniref:Tetratricopeptide repeat protein n=1 Tax=Pelotalea chapellei TaxID=44671 RepID=A0ABS5U3Y9_9BACT|nr:tetratricopeptide repeat protein [Pelotalea chapellei]MBT1070385.1 tetratricopeptide repeat protein [Pelotalea chapellei]